MGVDIHGCENWYINFYSPLRERNFFFGNDWYCCCNKVINLQRLHCRSKYTNIMLQLSHIHIKTNTCIMRSIMYPEWYQFDLSVQLPRAIWLNHSAVEGHLTELFSYWGSFDITVKRKSKVSIITGLVITRLHALHYNIEKENIWNFHLVDTVLKLSLPISIPDFSSWQRNLNFRTTEYYCFSTGYLEP
jgi:hypothetical protein